MSMYRRDFLLKRLQPLSQIIPQLLALRKAGDYEEALAVIERTGQRLIGMDPGLMNRLSTDSLVELLSAETLDGGENGLILATLFAEQGEVYEAQNNPDQAYPLYMKALQMYAHIMAIHVFRGYTHVLDEFTEKLKAYDIPATTLYDLFDYYTEIGSYARAEDYLFDLIDTDDPDPAMISDGIMFYRLLQAKSDEELIAGNLPRAEVEAGLQELLDMR